MPLMFRCHFAAAAYAVTLSSPELFQPDYYVSLALMLLIISIFADDDTCHAAMPPLIAAARCYVAICHYYDDMIIDC